MHQIRNYALPFDQDSLFEHYASGETTLALFVKLAPHPIWAGKVPTLGFTSHTSDVYLANHALLFKSSAGLNPSTAEIEAGKPSNIEMMSVFDDDAIRNDDLASGKWNNASYELFAMNYSAFAMGEWVIQSGIITETKDYQDYFVAEVAGRSVLTQTNFGTFTAKLCRCKKFGDFQCKKDLNSTTQDGFTIKKVLTVAEVISPYEIKFARIENVPNDFYDNGEIIGASGANSGIAREMKAGTGKDSGFVNITLKRAFPLNVEVGDTFELIAGCDRTLERCRYFQNVLNRRAEDFLPGLEKATTPPPVQ